MNTTIEGTWRSVYEYGKGPNNEMQTSEHDITFAVDGESWVGKSSPNEEGSVVTLILKQQGDQFQGSWKEQTSPSGSYGGREFSGTVLLVLQSEDTELKGMWLGVSSTTNQVKAGSWMLKR